MEPKICTIIKLVTDSSPFSSLARFSKIFRTNLKAMNRCSLRACAEVALTLMVTLEIIGLTMILLEKFEHEKMIKLHYYM